MEMCWKKDPKQCPVSSLAPTLSSLLLNLVVDLGFTNTNILSDLFVILFSSTQPCEEND
jgi:hypothetical protein